MLGTIFEDGTKELEAVLRTLLCYISKLKQEVSAMRYIVILLLIIGVGCCSCSRQDQVAREMSIEEYSDHIKIEYKDFQFIFAHHSAWEIDALIMDVSRSNEGPFKIFCGTFLLMWDDTAIELASYAGKDVNDIFDQLSEDAQNVILEHGCPAPYLNDHSTSILPIATDINVDKALRAAKKGDEVSLEGYRVSIESAQFKGNSQSINIPNTVCITKAVINGETYGE